MKDRVSKEDFRDALIYQSPIPVGWAVNQYAVSLDREEELEKANRLLIEEREQLKVERMRLLQTIELRDESIRVTEQILERDYEEMQKQSAKVAEQDKEIQRCKEIIGYYANKDNWDPIKILEDNVFSDGGETARMFLKALERNRS